MPNLATENTERRQRRASNPVLAIGYQLDQVVRDFELDCCLIADESGQVVAVSPESPTPFIRSFSQILPTMAMLPESREQHLKVLRRHRPDLEAGDLTACVFRAGGRRMYIGAVGGTAVMNEVAIFRAITGARRITAG